MIFRKTFWQLCKIVSFYKMYNDKIKRVVPPKIRNSLDILIEELEFEDKIQLDIFVHEG